MYFVMMMLFFFQGEDIRLANSPEKEGAVKLTKLVDIIDDGDGFYRSIDSSIAPDGRVVILDRGNYLIHIYSEDGKKLFSFGQEGNGPGELSRAGRLRALHSRILLVNFNRLIIFDYQGNLIEEVNQRYTAAALSFTENDFTFTFRAADNPPLLSETFSLDGKKVRQVKNPSTDAPVNWNELPIQERLRKFFYAPKEFHAYGDKFVYRFQGEYKFEYANLHGKKLNTFTRYMDRIKGEMRVPLNIRTEGDLSEEQKKRVAKMREDVTRQQLQMTGGFKNDIVEIIGVIDNHLLVHVASENEKVWKVDVISPSNTYYTSFEYTHEDLSWLTISNGKLIAECTNDDIGPYIKIYDLEIN